MSVKSYEIRVAGLIPPDELLEFDNLTSVVQPAQTVIRANAADRVTLVTILQRLQGLGLELTDVRRSEISTASPAVDRPAE